MTEKQILMDYVIEIKMLALSLYEDIKDSESAKEIQNKINKFYSDVDILKNNMNGENVYERMD